MPTEEEVSNINPLWEHDVLRTVELFWYLHDTQKAPIDLPDFPEYAEEVIEDDN